MPFRLKNEVDSWFSQIHKQGPLKTKFDLYYFCLMAGFSANKKSSSVEAIASEITDNFVAEYKPVQRLIIGLLIVAEIKKLGIEITDKDEVQGILIRYTTPESLTHLTEEGLKQLNCYASGGFDYLTKVFPTKPHTLEEFLRRYTQVVDSAVKSNDLLLQFQ